MRMLPKSMRVFVSRYLAESIVDFSRELRSNTWGLRGGSVRDKGNGVELVITRAGYGCKLTGKLRGKEVFDTEHLRSQHAIDGDKTELAFAMEEVGNV